MPNAAEFLAHPLMASVIMPFAVAALLAGVAPQRLVAGLGGLALAVAFTASVHLTVGLPQFPPLGEVPKLTLVALLAALLLLALPAFVHGAGARRLEAPLALVPLAGGLLWMALPFAHNATSMLVAGAVGLLGAGLLWPLSRSDVDDLAWFAVVLVAAFALAALAAAGNSLLLAQAAIALGCALAGTAAALRLRDARDALHTALVVAVIALAGLVTMTALLTDVPIAALLLLGLGLLPPLLVRRLIRSRLAVAGLSVLLAALLLTGALLVAAPEPPPADSPYYD